MGGLGIALEQRTQAAGAATTSVASKLLPDFPLGRPALAAKRGSDRTLELLGIDDTRQVDEGSGRRRDGKSIEAADIAGVEAIDAHHAEPRPPIDPPLRDGD